jgi:hypothetical protein
MPMQAVDPNAEEAAHHPLADDPRWQLVQRIAQSNAMRRATHLKRILIFVAETSLLHPDRPIHEQDIAHDVLGRRDDFDPAYDTIVRVQIRHLRNKLQVYFESEGAAEPLRMSLPRGSYRIIFEATSISTPPILDEETALPAAAITQPVESPARARWPWIAACALLCVTVAGAFFSKYRRFAPAEGTSTAQKMFPYLARGGGKVAVVLPDTSLLLLQKTLNTEIPLETYTQTSSRDQLALQADDARLSSTLSLLGRVRTTTLDEASVGVDFMQALTRAGMPGELRYARDLHIRDLGQGSYILIGNQRSDPWVTLFAGRDNFQYTGQPVGQRYTFHNLHPAPGEQAEYAPVESQVESVNYADITLTPNLTDSGYVLMIIGSDVPANEAAARFLMGNDLPPDLERILQHGSLRSLEILLRGHHLHGESNDKLAIVAYRITNRWRP